MRYPGAPRNALDGVDMAQTPPHKRNVNTVFQNYALFPHMTVGGNIAFGLEMLGRPKAEVDATVRVRQGQKLLVAPQGPRARRQPLAHRPTGQSLARHLVKLLKPGSSEVASARFLRSAGALSHASVLPTTSPARSR